MRVIERRVVSRGTEQTSAYENAFYLKASGPDMLRIRVSEVADDIYDACRLAYSSDYGASWSDDGAYQVSFTTPSGTVRKGYGTPVADPETGRLVVLDTTSVMPSDHMLEALTHTFPTYRVSEDGGVTWLFEDRIIQTGSEYSSDHPLDSVFTGKNGVHYANTPFFDRSGRLIAPIQITRLQTDGTLFCPEGALSVHEMMVLVGTWLPDGRMKWSVGDKVTL